MRISQIAASVVALAAPLIACLGVGMTTASAQTTSFTDRGVFEASLPAGFFFENFSSTPDAFAAPVASVTGSGGTPATSYEITAPTSNLGVFPDAGFKAVGNWNSSQNIIVSFTSSNVASAGGDIWLSDINGNRLAGNVTVDFSDGTQSLGQIVVPSTTSGTFGFAGITTLDGPIASMTLQAASPAYLNISNMSTAAVPEPATVTLVGLAACGLAAGAARRFRGRHLRAE